MYPSVLPAPQTPIVGAAALHTVLKGWVNAQTAVESQQA
jgi:hypothetical protein